MRVCKEEVKESIILWIVGAGRDVRREVMVAWVRISGVGGDIPAGLMAGLCWVSSSVRSCHEGLRVSARSRQWRRVNFYR